ATGKEMARLDNNEPRVAMFPLSTAGVVWQLRGSTPTCIRWLDIGSGTEVARCTHDTSIAGVAVSRDGQKIATAGQNHTVYMWDVRSAMLVATLHGHDHGPESVSFSPDGKRLVSGGAYPDNTVRLWNVTTAEPIAVGRGHGNTILSVTFSPDGTRIASASSDQTVRIWDGMTGKPVAAPLKGHS